MFCNGRIIDFISSVLVYVQKHGMVEMWLGHSLSQICFKTPQQCKKYLKTSDNISFHDLTNCMDISHLYGDSVWTL